MKNNGVTHTFKTLLLISVLVLDIPTFLSLQTQEANTIYLTDNSITWIYTGSINMSQHINELVMIMIPINSIVEYALNLSLKIPLNMSMKLSVDIVGGERVYYQFNSILIVENKTSENIRLNESFEGNIDIDWNDIVFQWYKHEIKMGLKSNNVTYTVIPLRKELETIALSKDFLGIKKIDGLYVMEQSKTVQKESFYLYDIYINKSHYLNSLFGVNNSLCEIINELPMRTSIDLTITTFTQEPYVKLSIQGSSLEDPIKAYQAHLCLLPLIIEVQEILKNTNISLMYPTGLLDVTLDLFSTINQKFIVNVLNIYAYIVNYIIKEKEYAHLLDSRIFFNYRNKEPRELRLTISNVDTYNYTAAQIKTLIKNVTGILAEVLQINGIDIDALIDESVMEIQNDHTVSKTFTNTTNNIGIQNILILIIIAVVIQTGVVVYMMIKIVLLKQSK